MKNKNRAMKKLHLLLLFYLTTWTTACSAITVKTDYEPGINFARFKTYDWMPKLENSNNLQEVIAASRVGYIIEGAVEKELAARGYEKEKRAGEKPDFYLAYRAQVKEKMEPKVITYSCGESICHQGISMEKIREGMLVLDIIEADSNQVVWRGTAVGVIGDPSKRKEAIEDAVGRMLRKFPPK